MTEIITTAPHGRCEECKTDLATPERVEVHMNETQEASPEKRSHRVWRLNPTVQQRLARAVEDAIDDALRDFCESMDDAIRRGDFTEEDVSKELRHAGDFADYWENWLVDGQDD